MPFTHSLLIYDFNGLRILFKRVERISEPHEVFDSFNLSAIIYSRQATKWADFGHHLYLYLIFVCTVEMFGGYDIRQTVIHNAHKTRGIKQICGVVKS